MTRAESTFLQMLAATRVTCDKFNAVWAGTASFFAAYHLGVIDIEEEVIALEAQQLSRTKGVTVHKQSVRKSLSERILFISSRIELYAATASNADLRREAHLSDSGLKRETDDALLGVATRTAGLAMANIAALGPFGVDAALVAALNANAAEYAGLIGTPARTRAAVSQATAALKELFKTSRAQLSLMDAHLVLWEESAPDFCSMYRTSRRIGKTPFRTRALMVAMKDSEGLPVAGAAFLLPSAKLKRKTSARGICWINHLSAGQYTARVSADGMAAREVEISINKSQTTKAEIVLQKAELINGS